jgi:hypothetical protein
VLINLWKGQALTKDPLKALIMVLKQIVICDILAA